MYSFITFPYEEIEQTLSQRFEKQAIKFAKKIAVSDESQSLTYKELNSHANQVAHAILKVDNTPFIGLYFTHSIYSMIAILGVLKSGKACINLNPLSSAQKNYSILKQTQVATILTQTKCYADLTTTIKNFLYIDIESITNEPSNNIDIAIDPTSYSCISHTTGSTGSPKGVLQNHRNVLHRVMKYHNAMKIIPSDRAAIFSHCSYAAGMINSLVFLLNGASIHLFDLANENLEKLGDWLIVNKITIYHSVPTIFLHFTQLLKNHKFTDIRLVRLGGESVDSRHFTAYKKHFPLAKDFIVSYGSTEANGIAFFFANHETKISSHVLPVGYPLPDSIVEIVDENKRPVCTGSTGEIRVTGDSLSLGYWKDAQQTQQCFEKINGKMTYYTGDFGYFDQNGCLYLLGRKDSVIKMLGQKISLNEVEAIISQHPQVKNCAIVVNKQATIPYLIAYITSPKMNFDENNVKDYLRKTLPQNMLPKKLIQIDEIPLTPNGKVNYKELPIPDLNKISIEYVAPRNFQENIICNAFQEVLKIENIGIYNDFFEMGGYSLLIVPLFEYIEKKMGTTLPVAAIFENATVQKLAIAFQEKHDEKGHVIAIREEGQKPPLICLHSIEGNALNYYCLAKSLGKDQPVYVINAPQKEDGTFIFYDSIEQKVAHYIELLQKKIPRSEYFLAGHSSGGILAYEMARQLTKLGITVSFLAIFDTTLPKTKKYWLNIKNLWHFIRYFPKWFLGLCKDKQKFQRLANIFGANLKIDRPPSWMNVLPRKTKEYIVKNQKLRQEYILKKNTYSGEIHLFRIYRENDNPKKRYLNDYGWKQYSDATIKTFYVAGEHREMMYQENIGSLSDAIENAIKNKTI